MDWTKLIINGLALVGLVTLVTLFVSAVVRLRIPSVFRHRRIERMPDDYEVPIEDDQWLK